LKEAGWKTGDRTAERGGKGSGSREQDTSERGGEGTVASGDCGEISGVSQGPRNAGGAGMHSTARHIPCCVGALTANCDSVR
jgi:hypothetical protein